MKPGMSLALYRRQPAAPCTAARSHRAVASHESLTLTKYKATAPNTLFAGPEHPSFNVAFGSAKISSTWLDMKYCQHSLLTRIVKFTVDFHPPYSNPD